MQSVQNHCTVLGVDFDASPEEVRGAYLKLVKQWHPDRFPDSPQLQQKAEAKIKTINQAYEALKSLSWTTKTFDRPKVNTACYGTGDRRWKTVLKTYSRPQVNPRPVNPALYQKFGR